MPELDAIYIIVSKEFEANRYHYLESQVKISLATYFEKGKVIFYEPYFKKRDESKLTEYNFDSTLLVVGEKALFLTYIHLFKKILDEKHENVLILESDVLFSNIFASKLNEVFNEWLQLTNDPSIVFLGNGCELKPKTPNVSPNLHLENRNKCTDSMIMNRSAVERVYSLIQKTELIKNPIDHFLDKLWGIQLNPQQNISGYWISKPIIMQGSQCGIYKSTIRY